MSYNELSVEERVTIQLGQAQGFSQRRIARLINRAPSTVSRELRRNREACGRYSVRTARRKRGLPGGKGDRGKGDRFI